MARDGHMEPSKGTTAPSARATRAPVTSGRGDRDRPAPGTTTAAALLRPSGLSPPTDRLPSTHDRNGDAERCSLHAMPRQGTSASRSPRSRRRPPQRSSRAVPAPLVLHGSSGVSDEGMRAVIAAGITKINVSAHLNAMFTGAVRHFLTDNPSAVDTRKHSKPAAARAPRKSNDCFVGTPPSNGRHHQLSVHP